MELQAANNCELEPVAYEFFTQAFVLYEEEIAAANDCELEPVAYEFFTQAFVLYEEEIAVTREPRVF
ncbi:hypothetical protein QVD17_14952 [Tagetes erecta]|uniref:Uncharacterized protein n=1 Tax=Tagetes erecta TaxID=13708 RepID=A0AAD8KSA3_TARER|nr:hypothetical protein QVD17_14952 [Tagetes erecta]